MSELYNLRIQQLYRTFILLSQEYHKTPHQIWEDVLNYHGKIRAGLVDSSQTDITFFLELSKRAIEFSRVKKL